MRADKVLQAVVFGNVVICSDSFTLKTVAFFFLTVKDLIMSTQLQVFQFENSSIRTVELEGVVWFVGKDVASTLGYENTAQAVRVHCRQAKSLISMGACGVLPTLDPQTKVIPESDVYRMIVHSQSSKSEKLKCFLIDSGFVFNYACDSKFESKEQLYVVLFDFDVIKVGKGKNALTRVREHIRQAATFERRVVNFFIEDNPEISEEDLIKFCCQNGRIWSGNEYFKNLKYEQVVNFVKRKVERKVLKLVQNC